VTSGQSRVRESRLAELPEIAAITGIIRLPIPLLTRRKWANDVVCDLTDGVKVMLAGCHLKNLRVINFHLKA